MKNFIYNLFNNEHFTLYLTIILVILVILFFIVLFMGKKDKKLQETKRLELIKENDAFKEESASLKVEVEEKKEEEQIPEPENVVETVFTPEKNNNLEVDTLIEEKEENHFDELSKALEKDLNDLENIKKEFKEITLPKKEDLPLKENNEVKDNVQVFSSVFVPKKEVEDMDMDLPTLKAVKKEEVVEEVEKPTFGIDLDSIEGESYDLKN